MLKKNNKDVSQPIDGFPESFSFTRENFEFLLKKTADQRNTIQSLQLSQYILTSLCSASLYSIYVIEAIRSVTHEILDFNIQKINTKEKFSLEEVSYSSEKDAIGELSEYFTQNTHPQIVEKEYSFLDEKGKLHWFISKKYPAICTEEGLPKQILLITEDITEKKNAAITLQENQHFIKSIADSTPDILYVIDLTDLKIIYINNAVFDLLRYTPEQVINAGNTVINLLFHPADQKRVRNHLRLFKRKPHHLVTTLEYRMKDAFGEWHYIRCRHSVFKVNDQGIVTQLLGIGQNVTDLKKSQEEGIRIKLLQHRAISHAILKTQEHERNRIAEALHNNLGQILYVAKLKLSMLDNEKKISEKRILEIKKTVNDLLEEAIIETKTISFELMPGILKDFGLEIAIKEMLKKTFQKLHLKSSIHLVGLKKRLDTDMEIAIFRIVQELINNSIKHAKARKVDLYISKGSDYININLSDDGAGFNKEILNNKHEGYGLRNITNRVEVLNGKLVINTNKSNGTQINIDIPLEEK